MSRVILVRHGETTLNRDLRYSGQRDAPLTPRGLEQEALLRTALSGTQIGRVVCSDTPHVLMLAGRLAADHGMHAEPQTALREASFGAWEGLTYDEAFERDRQAMVLFNRGAPDTAPPDGESPQALEARVRPLVDRLLRDHRRVAGALLIVSHGGTLRTLLCSLLAIPLQRHWTLRVDPASCTVLDIYPLGPIVELLNDTCHLKGLR